MRFSIFSCLLMISVPFLLSVLTVHLVSFVCWSSVVLFAHFSLICNNLTFSLCVSLDKK